MWKVKSIQSDCWLLTTVVNNEARYLELAYYVPTTLILTFWLNFLPNEKEIEKPSKTDKKHLVNK